MKVHHWLSLVVFGISTSLFAGDVTGKVSYKGPAPKNDAVKMNADPVCAKENAGKTVKKDDVLVTNGNLANVFVYIKDYKGAATPAATDAITFDQKGCMYHPRVFGVRAGQPIKILNSDPTLHNVHSMPKAQAGFNAGMAGKAAPLEKKFAKPEMGIKIKCDVHSWMAATANVMEHPYFAVTAEDGTFKINGVPAGEYTIEAWHEKLPPQTAKVTVTDAGGKADFTMTGGAAE